MCFVNSFLLKYTKSINTKASFLHLFFKKNVRQWNIADFINNVYNIRCHSIRNYFLHIPQKIPTFAPKFI